MRRKKEVKLRGVGAHLLQLDRVSTSDSAIVGISRSLDYWSILTISEVIH